MKRHKGRRWKRAEYAMRKIHLKSERNPGSNYDKGYVMNVVKSHPKWFIAMMHDEVFDKWFKVYCMYRSTYYKVDEDGWRIWIPR